MGGKQTKTKGAYYPSKEEQSAFAKSTTNNQDLKASASKPIQSGPREMTKGNTDKYDMFQVVTSKQDVSVSPKSERYQSEVDEIAADAGYSQIIVRDGKMTEVVHDKGDPETSESEYQSESSEESVSEGEVPAGRVVKESLQSQDSEQESDDESSQSDEHTAVNPHTNELTSDVKVPENTSFRDEVELNHGEKYYTASSKILKDSQSKLPEEEDFSNVEDDTEEQNEITFEQNSSVLQKYPVGNENVEIYMDKEVQDSSEKHTDLVLRHSYSKSAGDISALKSPPSPSKDSQLTIPSDLNRETPRSVSSLDSESKTLYKRSGSWLQKLKSLKRRSQTNKSPNSLMYGRSVSVPTFPGSGSQKYLNRPSASDMDLASSSRSTTPRGSTFSTSVGNIRKMILRSISRNNEDEPELEIGYPVLTDTTKDLQHITGKKIQIDGLSPRVSDLKSDLVAVLDLDDFEERVKEECPGVVRKLSSTDKKEDSAKFYIKSEDRASDPSNEMDILPEKNKNEISDNFQEITELQITKEQSVVLQTPVVDEQASSCNSSDVFLPDDSKETCDIPANQATPAPKTLSKIVPFSTLVVPNGAGDSRKKSFSSEDRNLSSQTPSEANFDAIHWPSLSSVAVSQNRGSVHLEGNVNGFQTIENLRSSRFVSYSLEDVRKPKLSLVKGNSMSSEQIHSVEKETSNQVSTVQQRNEEIRQIPVLSDSTSSSSGQKMNEKLNTDNQIIPEIHFRKRSTSYSSDSFYSKKSNDTERTSATKQNMTKQDEKKITSVDNSCENTSNRFEYNAVESDLNSEILHQIPVTDDQSQISTNEYVENWVIQSMSHMEKLHTSEVESPKIRASGASLADDENSSSDNQSDLDSVQSVVEKNIVNLRTSSETDQIITTTASKDYSSEEVVYAPQSTSSILTFKNFNYVKREGERIILVNMPPRTPQFPKTESNDSDKLRSTLEKSLRTSQSVSDILETDRKSDTSSSEATDCFRNVQGEQPIQALVRSLPSEVDARSEDKPHLLTSAETVQLKNADDILKYSIMKSDSKPQSPLSEPSANIVSKKVKGPETVTEKFQNIIHWGSSRIRKSFQRLKNSNKNPQSKEKAQDLEDERKRLAFLKEALDPNVEAIFIGDVPHSSREGSSDWPRKTSNIQRTVSNIEVFSKSKFQKDDTSGNNSGAGRKVSVISRTPDGYFTVKKRALAVVDQADQSSLSATQLETASDSELETSPNRKDSTYSKLMVLEKTTEGRVMFDPTSPRKSPEPSVKRIPPPRPTSLPLKRKVPFEMQNNIYATVTRKNGKQKLKNQDSTSDVSDSESKHKPPVPPRSHDIHQDEDSASEITESSSIQELINEHHIEIRENRKKKLGTSTEVEPQSGRTNRMSGFKNQEDINDATSKQATTSPIPLAPPRRKKSQSERSKRMSGFKDQENINDVTSEAVTTSALPLAPPRKKKMTKETSVISGRLSENLDELEAVDNNSNQRSKPENREPKGVHKPHSFRQNVVVHELEHEICESTKKKNVSSSSEISVDSSVNISGKPENQTVTPNKESVKKTSEKKAKEVISESIVVSERDCQKDITVTRTSSKGKSGNLAPPRPKSSPATKEKKLQTQKSKPKENYKTKYKGSSLIQFRKEDDRSTTSSQCSTERKTRVLKELHNQLSISSQDTTFSENVTALSLHQDTSQANVAGGEPNIVSSQENTVSTVSSNKLRTNVTERISPSKEKHASPHIYDEVPKENMTMLKNKSASVTKVSPRIASGKVEESGDSLEKTHPVKHIYDDVPQEDVEILRKSDVDFITKEITAERVVSISELEENEGDSLIISKIPVTLQPRNRIPLRIKRRYPQHFDVPDDSDGFNSDSTECLSDIGTADSADMEPDFYPAGLFEHVAKMSRLADPEEFGENAQHAVPPVRVRRNFTTNGGKDMVTETVNIPKSKVKPTKVNDTKAPPTISRTPPTPEMIDRNKPSTSGAVPPYEPGPETSRKLSSEKDYVKDRMRRRESESSTATQSTLQQYESNSNKDNTKGDSSPDHKVRHHHHKKSHKKHKKHKNKEHREKEREPRQHRSKDRDGEGNREAEDRPKSSHRQKGHRNHRARSRSRERSKSEARSRSVDETASDTTLVATEVSAGTTEAHHKHTKQTNRRDRSRPDSRHKDSKGQRRSRSHSHKRSPRTRKDSFKSERDSVKGRNMRALPHHSHKFPSNSRPKNTDLLDLLMNQQYEHQVHQEAQMAARVLVNKAYKDPETSHRTKDKKVQELLNNAYPLSQRSFDSAKESTSLPPMSSTTAGSIHTEPVSGRRNPSRYRQHSVSPPRAGSALERLLTEGSLVKSKHQGRAAVVPPSSRASFPQVQSRWASHPGIQAWNVRGGGAALPAVGIEKEVLLQAIRDEIRLLHGPEAAKS